jgi:hypothetical protein
MKRRSSLISAAVFCAVLFPGCAAEHFNPDREVAAANKPEHTFTEKVLGGFVAVFGAAVQSAAVNHQDITL